MAAYSYLVGGLIATVSPAEEQEKLNECSTCGWELVTVLLKKHKGSDYIFFYFRRPEQGSFPKENPRFDLHFSD
jgi:hypothetical protein